MLFFILLAGIVALTICAIVLEKNGHDDAGYFVTFSAIAVGVIWIVMFIIMLFGYITADANKAEYEEDYKAIIYECESVEAKDEFGIINKDFIDDVREWNDNLAYKQEITHSFWVGIIYPNYYDDFELIDLDSISFGGITENVS